LAFGAKKIQLWHGVGFKKIELELLKEYRKRMKVTNWLVFVAYRYLAGRYPLYDAVISTSPFYTTHVFENSLRARKILDYGYPRNDILKGNNLFDENNLKLLYAKLEVIKLLKELKKDGFRIVMYAPTFRDSGGDPVSDGALDLRSLNELGEKQRILFILKFHPDPGFKYVRTAYPFVITYPHDHDAYPILKLCDLLVTDYSSIYSDFLFVGKPIIFFPYDFEKYVRQDRSIQFEYEKSTPGAKCYTMQELVEEIPIALENDEYKEKRIKCAKKMFKYIDGRASERIWRYILETFFVNTYTM
jgi:CDP-glycerol glycerophosphotransferase